MDFFQNLTSNEFLPHGHCIAWRPGLLWLHILSDGFIALSYYSIPIALGYFVNVRKDLAYKWMFYLFSAFIFACGTTHLMGIVTLWEPVYWADGGIKAMTAGVSVLTAIVLWPVIPKAIALPSPAELAAANQELRKQIAERLQVEKEVKKLNEALQRRAADLEAAVKELEGFSYTVSHDLRAPLRAINGYSLILSKEYAPHLPAEARRYLNLVRENTGQMGDLIDDLLNFSRLNRQEIRKQLVEPAEIARQVYQELQAEWKGRQVELKIGDLPACRADPALLKQVWVNLLTNALKYTSKRERAVIEIGCHNEMDKPVYFVKDNGVGFDMRYASKLYGVFQRLHRAEDYEGTGVGLATVQRIVHRHGGQIWAEAEVDRGATFYFTL